MNRIVSIAALAAVATAISGPVSGHSHKMKEGMPGAMHGKQEMHGKGHHRMDGVKVVNAWARATPGKAKNGGAYITVMNHGDDDDRLVGAKADVAKRVEIHTHLNENGVMRMRQVDGIDLPAGSSIRMKPGGYHVMFLGLHKPLEKGESFPVTLVFEKAGELETTVTVRSVGAMSGSMKGGMEHRMQGQGHGHGQGHGGPKGQ
jgi:copper(I)-binding protein